MPAIGFVPVREPRSAAGLTVNFAGASSCTPARFTGIREEIAG
jgi:hypothetical protein